MSNSPHSNRDPERAPSYPGRATPKSSFLHTSGQAWTFREPLRQVPHGVSEPCTPRTRGKRVAPSFRAAPVPETPGGGPPTQPQGCCWVYHILRAPIFAPYPSPLLAPLMMHAWCEAQATTPFFQGAADTPKTLQPHLPPNHSPRRPPPLTHWGLHLSGAKPPPQPLTR